MRKQVQLLLLGTVQVILTLLTCAPKEKSVPGTREAIPAEAVVLFVIGDVRANGSPLKAGEVVESGKWIETGAASSCDLQVRGPAAGVAVRLQEMTKFHVRGFQSGSERTYRGVISQGVALFTVTKLSAKENIEAQAPTALAGVRGTSFLFSFLRDTAVASVREGKLSMRPALGVLEDQAGGLVGESRLLTNLYDSMQEDSVNLEPGQTTSISRADIDAKYEAASAVIDMIAGAKPGSDTIQLARAIDEKYGASRLRNPTPIAKPENLAADVLGGLAQNFLGLSPVETSMLKDTVSIGQAIATRNQANQGELLGLMSQVRQQQPETLILRDGRRVRGLIYEQGGSYIVESPVGTQVYPRPLVEGYAF